MNHRSPHILFVNPWIHDFAAYDVWAKPVGLLSIAAILRMHGFSISYIDCLDRFHPKAKPSDPMSRNGRGPYLKTRIPPPKGLEAVGRRFSRYGILPEWFTEDLKSIPKPDVILITCLMTYWYPGLFETIRAIRTVFPQTPIILGGIYATLCHAHATRYSGADHIVTGAGEKKILELIGIITGKNQTLNFDPDNLNTYPYPAFDLQRKTGYIPLLTSLGCPFSCAYCASNFLQPNHMKRHPDLVAEEILYWHDKFGVKEFAFYDDALLVNADQHAVPMFNRIIKTGRNLRFHTPNAVHIRKITSQIAVLMFKAGVKTLRMGLETTDFTMREMDRKVKEAEFIQAVSYLLEAGFQKEQVGAYLLVGLPGQSVASVELSIKTVQKSGITPILAYYSPIPHTDMWEAAKAASRYDLEADPVFTNNAVMPCQKGAFDWDELTRLKQRVKFP
ncbi:MAG: B12-binding domain-containing radical SAM protein [Deltaproteobacteria bacterium]|nr:MAG: B12-binding domain-containing radical SAM protein [Deltaproteobacteria bacterium]